MQKGRLNFLPAEDMVRSLGKTRPRPFGYNAPLGPAARTLEPGLPPKSVGPVGAHHPATTRQEDLGAAVSKAWILRPSLAHRSNDRGIPRRPLRASSSMKIFSI